MIAEASEFISHCEEKGYADSTLNEYSESLELFSTWLSQEGKTITDLNAEDIEEFIDWTKSNSDFEYTRIASVVFPKVEKFIKWKPNDVIRNPCEDVSVDDVLLVEGGSKYLSDKENALEDSTHKNRRTGLLQFSEWIEREKGGAHPTEITPGGIENYLSFLAGKDYTSGTLSDKFTTVSQLYKNMKKHREWDVDPTEEAKSSTYIDYNDRVKKNQRLKKEDRYISEEEKDKLLSNVPAPKLRNELLIELMWQTGLRIGEVASIELKDLDRDKREIWIPKFKSKSDTNRTVFYEPSLDTKLNLWLDGGERSSSKYASESKYLFLTQRAEKLDKEHIGKIVRQAAERAGIQTETFEDASGASRRKISAHSIRHGFAVYSLNNGMDLLTLSKIMGHEDLNTTKRYLHYTTEEDRIEYLKSRQQGGE